RYIFEYYPKRNLLGGSALGEWYRNNVKKIRNPYQARIIIRLKSLEEMLFSIEIEKNSGSQTTDGLFLGKKYNMVGAKKFELGEDFYLSCTDLLTHVFICGITGSGKTVLGKAIIEEAARKRIPSIIIDLKGDLSSLALAFSNLDPDELLPWIDQEPRENLELRAAQEAEYHISQLESYGITRQQVVEFKKNLNVRIFTPRSSKGIPLAFASTLGAPENVKELYDDDPDSFHNLLSSLINAFVDRLYPNTKRTKIENERNYLYEIVQYAWRHDINLEGEKGLRTLLQLVANPPFSTIGELTVEQYICTEKRLERLLNKINTMLTGAEKMWFEGQSLDIDEMVAPVNGKTNINIINLTELDHFEDRSFAVAHIAYELYKWMRKLSGTGKPRVVFFIDEIGGGGGKQALFPSFPYECAAKWGLNYLIRQGRAFGVCCVFATQNPGDVDYKGLSNCHTWIVGKLSTEQDRKKVIQGMALWGTDADIVKHNLATANTGDFVVRTPRGEISIIHERWLMTYHRVLTMEEISLLTG
ncbi:MAG: ATP-binding protein, partial [Candidatus Methanofastidiosa archaeon]|nr:ATP-binding protein [Candidatus Methanofastidiosa archaeon]